jgi:hypothetical protein
MVVDVKESITATRNRLKSQARGQGFTTCARVIPLFSAR